MDDNQARSLEFQDPLVGRVLQERYRVVRMIGRGGMGVVYLAEHVRIERKVAIKLLHSQLAGSEELVQRFHREARAAAAVGSEHIVDVIDMGRLDDGTYFIVLEYLDGLDLGAVVALEGPLPIARALQIADQICDALTAVHAAGIVHRDLKPENIVLIPRGRASEFVKVLDFGICKVLNEQALTATGLALGTPRFMAPEQLEARRDVDHRADIYAVGGILYFALSGLNPFNGDSLPRLLVSIWSDPAPRLREVRPDVPEVLEALIARALEKDPARRFPDARALGDALAAIAKSLGAPRRVELVPHAVESALPELPQAASAETSEAVESAVVVSQKYRRKRRLRTAAASVALCASVFGLMFWIHTLVAAVPSRAPAQASAQDSVPQGLGEGDEKPQPEQVRADKEMTRDLEGDRAAHSQPTIDTATPSAAPQPSAAARGRASTDRARPAPQPPAAVIRSEPATHARPSTDSQPSAAPNMPAPTADRGTASPALAPLVPAPAQLKRVF